MPRRLFFTTATAFLGAWMMGGTAQAASALVLTVKTVLETDPPYVVTVDNLTIPVFNDEGRKPEDCQATLTMAHGKEASWSTRSGCEWLTEPLNSWTFQANDRLLNPLDLTFWFMHSPDRQSVLVGVPASQVTNPKQDLPPGFHTVTEVQAKRRVKPKYPASAQADGVEGMCVVIAVVDKKGKAESVSIDERREKECPEPLRDAAVTAVEKWVFVPAKFGDVVLSSGYVLHLNFDLSH